MGINNIISSKTFESDDAIAVLMVADYSPNKVTDEIVSFVGENRTTINDVDGYISLRDGYYVFNYENDTRMVIITATDENIIGDFLIS